MNYSFRRERFVTRSKRHVSRVLAFAFLLSLISVPIFSEPARADTSGSGACLQTFTKTGTGQVDVFEADGYCYVAFKNTGSLGSQTTFNWTRPTGLPRADVLVIGGGGGGGARHGGGGGAGAYIEATSYDISSASTVSIVVGAGGAGANGTATYTGNNGAASSVKLNSSGLTANGGGAGTSGAASATTGSSSGGSGYNQTSGSVSAQTQTRFDGTSLSGITFGNVGSGGTNDLNTGVDNNYDYWAGGGGGGAGNAGSRPTSNGTEVTTFPSGSWTTARGGNGGNGKFPPWLTSTAATNLSVGQISGSNVYFAGGGGGGIGNDGAAGGTGGLGGGANGTRSESSPTAALSHTGGGGGGGGFDDISPAAGFVTNGPGSNGGSGVVVIRYTVNQTTGTSPCVQTVTTSTGVSVSQVGNDCVVTFTSGSNYWIVPSNISSARVLVVGGGGAGGASIGGGGGAGEMYVASSYPLTAGSERLIAVGAGGTARSGTSGTAGGNSTFDVVTAYGGGGGGANASNGPTAAAGPDANNRWGSSGGGSFDREAVLAPTSRSSVSNGLAYRSTGGSAGGGTCATATAGGGGGAGGAGGNGSTSNGGAGGLGLSSDITGTTLFYAGGGGGGINAVSPCTSSGNPGTSGSGVGGAGGPKSAPADGNPGVANTGSGGGGASNSSLGGAGAAGVVIIRYSLQTQAALTVSPITGFLGTTLSLTTSGGSGTGAVTYSVTSAGTAGCSVSGSTLSYTNVGTCSVTATKAAADGFQSVSSSATVITISAYTVTYNSNGGSSVASGTFAVGGSIASAPTPPTRTGYTFAGWSATDGGSAITFPYTPGVSANITLYGRWNAAVQSVDYTVNFDGQNSKYASVSSQIIPNSSRFTAEAWFKSNDTVSFRKIFSQGDLIAGSGQRQWDTSFYVEQNSGKIRIVQFAATPYVLDCGNYTTNSWTHVAVVYSNPGLSCYINGALTGSDNAKTLIATTAKFMVGNFSPDPSAASCAWNGAIDEVRIYNLARSQSQIQADLKTYGPVTDSNLIAYYDFNEGSGTTATNQKSGSSSATDLNLSGSPTWSDIATTSSNGTKTVVTFPRSYLNNSGGWAAPAIGTSLNYLVIAGGGGGGAAIANQHGGGGGGAGGYRTNVTGALSGANSASEASFTVAASVYEVVVGQGGLRQLVTSGNGSPTTPAGKGGDSKFANITALGGGGGADYYGNAATVGGSGGGGAISNLQTRRVGAAGTSLQGFKGGDASSGTFDTNAGGGGGAGSAGGDGSVSNPGAGGNGLSSSITGANITRASGGSGGSSTNSTTVTSATVNTGNGGGGGSVGGTYATPGDGGSGIVIVSWTSSYSISYASGGGSGSAPSSPSSVGLNSSFITPSSTFNRTGYTFAGWSDGTSIYAEGARYPSSGNVSNDVPLIATWTANTYTITYDTNGGNSISSSTFTVGGTAITLPTPTKSGYTFDGWYEASNLSGTALSSTYSPTQSRTIYAKWTQSTFTVTYNSNGGSQVTAGSFDLGGSISSAPTSPTLSGYRFAGWSATNGGSIISFPYSPGVANDITLYANWIGVPFLSYNSSDLNTYSSSSTSVTDLSTNGFNATTVGSVGFDSSTGTSLGSWFFSGGTNAAGPYIDVANLSSSNFSN